jgi:predicted small secreted protein
MDREFESGSGCGYELAGGPSPADQCCNRSALLERVRTIETKQAMNKFIIIALLLLTVALGGIACKNTAHGVGQDVENAGEKIQEKTD